MKRKNGKEGKGEGFVESHGDPGSNFDFFDLFPVPYQSLDGNGKIVRVNEKWLDLLSYDRKEVKGRDFGDFLTAESNALFNDYFAEFKEEGEIHGVKFELLQKDGPPFESHL